MQDIITKRRASARRTRRLIQDIWTDKERCLHRTYITKVVPAEFTDDGDWLDAISMTFCANRRCNYIKALRG